SPLDCERRSRCSASIARKGGHARGRQRIMAEKRVYALAKELGTQNKALVDWLQAHGYDEVKSHSSSLDDDQAQAVTDKIMAERNPAPAAPPPRGFVVRRRRADIAADPARQAAAREAQPAPAPAAPAPQAAAPRPEIRQAPAEAASAAAPAIRREAEVAPAAEPERPAAAAAAAAAAEEVRAPAAEAPRAAESARPAEAPAAPRPRVEVLTPNLPGMRGPNV